MFYFINRLSGVAHVRICGDMPEIFLNNCAEAGIEIISAIKRDCFTAEMYVHHSELKKTELIAAKSFCQLEVLNGGRKWLKVLRKKALPTAIIILICAVIFWSKFYVWEIELRGNESVPDGKILSVLSQCGVKSGAFWPDFSADNIRSRVLYMLPELNWITVNMHGSLAEVIVVERKMPPEVSDKDSVTNIVAIKDGFVTEVNALAGQSLVKRGDAVKKGDILISGIVESSFSPPRKLTSLGNIKGETNREIIAVTPEIEQIKAYTGATKRKFALIIGNKRINFYSDSSISDSFCDKIISVWNMEIEGLVKLPVSLVLEESNYYSVNPGNGDEYISSQWLEQILRKSFSRETDAEEILSEHLSFGKRGGLLVGSLRIRCVEELGCSVPIPEEQILESEMKYNKKADDK